VEGVLYFVKEEDLVVLDEYEGVADQQYVRHEIEVQDRTGHPMPAVAMLPSILEKNLVQPENI